jgi:hypothetical protein|tara:strand:+ start:343 stop:609 length:267 start_codon:yes stop_codon:yes gene_type:complete
MREYTIKIVIALVALYVLFKITIGSLADSYVSKIKSFTDHSQRIIFKEKILEEMKKGTEKPNFFSSDEKIIISNFLNKIIDELNIKVK